MKRKLPAKGARPEEWWSYLKLHNDQRETEWYPAYQAYLNSHAWAWRRSLEISRNRGVCGVCLLQIATQVHHETYENTGHERFGELTAVCSRCHQREHDLITPEEAEVYTKRRDDKGTRELLADAALHVLRREKASDDQARCRKIVCVYRSGDIPRMAATNQIRRIRGEEMSPIIKQLMDAYGGVIL